MRQNYDRMTLSDFRGGINLSPENAQQNQVADALNMWAPNGRVVTRPGYHPVAHFAPYSFSSQGGGVPDTFAEMVGGTLYVYIGVASADASSILAEWRGIAFTVDAGSAINNRGAAGSVSYWNGAAWVQLPAFWDDGNGTVSYMDTLGSVGDTNAGSYPSATPVLIWPLLPADLAQTTVNSLTRYWFRLQIRNGGASPVTRFDTSNGSELIVNGDADDVLFFKTVRFPSGKTINFLLLGTELVSLSQLGSYLVSSGNGQASNFPFSFTRALVDDPTRSLPTLAPIPLFEECFATIGYSIYKLAPIEKKVSGLVSADQPELQLAAVSTDPLSVGPDAPYDPTLKATLPEYPRAKFITYFENQLFVANLKDNPYAFMWSAPYISDPDVWPVTNIEYLIEDDNSPITGMTSYSENLMLFKADSIWQVIYGGTSVTGENVYTPRKIVSGVGTSSNESIQRTPVGMVFLWEDGVYLFDGTPNVKKVSGALDEFFSGLNEGRLSFAASCHWKKRHCYLLSVSTNGYGENNKTVVWDYKHNAWWIWDIGAVSWAKDEDPSTDEEVIYFLKDGLCHQLETGFADYGASIPCRIKTHRLFDDGQTRTLREVNVNSTNANSSITVEVTANDAPSGSTAAISYADDSEAKWGTAVWDTDAWVKRRRRDRKLGCRETGEWFQVEVSDSVLHRPLEVNSLQIGTVSLGRR